MNQEPFIPGTLYRHRHGGIYTALFKAKHSDDASDVVVYEHVWPFEPNTRWVRPASEWTPDRFAPIDESDLSDAIDKGREASVAEVLANKLGIDKSQVAVTVTTDRDKAQVTVTSISTSTVVID